MAGHGTGDKVNTIRIDLEALIVNIIYQNIPWRLEIAIYLRKCLLLTQYYKIDLLIGKTFLNKKISL